MKSLTLQCIALLLILVFTGVMISSGQIPIIDECTIARLICTAMENYAQSICKQPGPVNFERCRAARQAALEVCLAAEMICSGGCY